MKPDWDYIRSYLISENFLPPSPPEETDEYQLQLGYLIDHGFLRSENSLDGLARYSRTQLGVELAGLMNDDDLWEKAKVELIDNPKFTDLVKPDQVLIWLRQNTPSEAF